MSAQLTYSVSAEKINSPIYIGKGSFDKIKSLTPFNKYSYLLVLIDDNVSIYWDRRIHKVIGTNASYISISPGEKNKTLSTVQKIWATLSKEGFDRKSLVVNIGGGMVCDVGAFAASTYMRGIPFVQVPTTLLAQADAAVGGKTGFNFNGLKNTIGTFSAPAAVISDASFLTTLPKREYSSGFAEIIKHAIIADTNLFDFLLKKNFLSAKGKELDKILTLSTAIKCKIVGKDPYEKKGRKKLNFGHTVGHAIEMVCQDSFMPLLHGEAVAIGMLAEARMSLLCGALPGEKFRAIENLIRKARLPNKVDRVYKNVISKKMQADKKNFGRQIKWVFLEDIGKVKVDAAIPDKIVDEGLNYILK